MHLVFCFEGFSFVKCILWTKQVCREHDINVPVYERPRGDAMCFASSRSTMKFTPNNTTSSAMESALGAYHTEVTCTIPSRLIASHSTKAELGSET